MFLTHLFVTPGGVGGVNAPTGIHVKVIAKAGNLNPEA